MIADEPAKGSRILLGARRGSGGQEGGWVVRGGEELGTEGDEVGVVGGRGGEGVDGLGGGEGLLAECFGFAALCGVEDENAVGEGGDAGVAAEAEAAVARRWLSGKVERSRRRLTTEITRQGKWLFVRGIHALLVPGNSAQECRPFVEL